MIDLVELGKLSKVKVPIMDNGTIIDLIKVEKLNITTNIVLSDQALNLLIKIKKQFNEVKIQTMEKENNTNPIDIFN
jgi:hypothetical protein